MKILILGAIFVTGFSLYNCTRRMYKPTISELAGSVTLCDTIKAGRDLILRGKNNQLFLLPGYSATELNYGVTEKDILAMPQAGLLIWDNSVILFPMKHFEFCSIIMGKLAIASEADKECDATYSSSLQNFDIVYLKRNIPDYYLKLLLVR